MQSTLASRLLPHRISFCKPSSAFIVFFCSVLAANKLFAADVSGDWEFTGKYLNDPSYARVNLKTEDGKLTGNLNELSLEGTVKDNELTFTAKRPNGDHFGDFTGKVNGDELEGTAVWFRDRKVTWSAK